MNNNIELQGRDICLLLEEFTPTYNMQALIQDFKLDRGEEAPLDDDRSVWESLTPPPPCSTYSMIDSENLLGGGSEVKTIVQ